MTEEEKAFAAFRHVNRTMAEMEKIMTRKHPPAVQAYAALNYHGEIIPNSVSDTIQGVRLRAGEGPVVKVWIIPVEEREVL